MRLRAFTVLTILVLACGAAGSAHETGLETETEVTGDAKIRVFEGVAAPNPADAGGFDLYGAFPNDHNPFRIDTTIALGMDGFGLRGPDRGLLGELPGAGPDWALNMIPFGVAIDGVIIDPSGPWYSGGAADPENPFDRACTGWEYEVNDPRVGAIVGMPDEVRGHVQPSGMFHYHGRPARMIAAARQRAGNPDDIFVVGYSADGWPIIDHRLRNTKGEVIDLVSGYRLRQGQRNAVPGTDPAQIPKGRFDGLYVQDYVFDPVGAKAKAPSNAVVLDARNGIVLGDGLPTLPGYPSQHYAYVMTTDWPQIPRMFAGPPSPSFAAVIPLDSTAFLSRMAAELGLTLQPVRRAIYDNCPGTLQNFRLPNGRAPY
jgi:hypothetical protein